MPLINIGKPRVRSDKAKGIIAKPMPRYWYDISANQLPDNATDEEIAKREFNLRIVADKKPYFMRYIYPALMSQYKSYIKSTNINSLRTFRVSLDELLAMNESDLSDEQREFLYYYRRRMPVSNHDCVMNRICRKFEAAFESSRIFADLDFEFDYTFLKSGAEYTEAQSRAIEHLFKQHHELLTVFAKDVKNRRYNEEETIRYKATIVRYFTEECAKVCSNAEQLCDILLDICYHKNSSHQFVWEVASDTIINNLIKKGNVAARIEENDEGDIEYVGRRYSYSRMEVYEDD